MENTEFVTCIYNCRGSSDRSPHPPPSKYSGFCASISSTMLPPNQSTADWPVRVNGTLIRDAPYQVVRDDTPPPEVRGATPTKHQSARGSPYPQPGSSRFQDQVHGESRPVPVAQKDPSVRPPEFLLPPVKPAHTLAPNNSHPPVKALRTLAPKNPAEKPALTPALKKRPARSVRTPATDNPPDLPEKVLPKELRCRQCTQPTPDVRDFTHIRLCPPC